MLLPYCPSARLRSHAITAAATSKPFGGPWRTPPPSRSPCRAHRMHPHENLRPVPKESRLPAIRSARIPANGDVRGMRSGSGPKDVGDGASGRGIPATDTRRGGRGVEEGAGGESERHCVIDPRAPKANVQIRGQTAQSPPQSSINWHAKLSGATYHPNARVSTQSGFHCRNTASGGGLTGLDTPTVQRSHVPIPGS
jgi:hypothetical protein